MTHPLSQTRGQSMGDQLNRCESCRFAEVKELDEDEMYCHRHPPILDAGFIGRSDNFLGGWDNSAVWVFPVVERDAWCGEFRSIELPMIRCDNPDQGRIVNVGGEET